MREIEYRGKNAKGEWVYGSLIINDVENDKGKFQAAFIVPGLPCASDGGDFYTARMERVEIDTIGQFTGVVDSMNRRIYEGDVLNVTLNEEYDNLGRFKGRTDIPPYLKAVVRYNERMCKFELLFEENEQCGDHHLVSCEIGWEHETFLIVGKFIEMPFKLECDRPRR